MEFDKSRVYTALNADEVKPGSRGYGADTLNELKDAVLYSNKGITTILSISSECDSDRFNFRETFSCPLFYLVEEPQGTKLRPYQNEDEVAEVIAAKNGVAWIKNKHSGVLLLITCVCGNHIKADEHKINLTDLCADFTFLDGSPCGVEED